MINQAVFGQRKYFVALDNPSDYFYIRIDKKRAGVFFGMLRNDIFI